MKIDRVFFLIHPACWALSDGRPDLAALQQLGTRRASFFAAEHWEQRVIELQKTFIESLGQRDAMVIYPIGDTPAMCSLIETARTHLGDRCIVQQASINVEPAALHDMTEPIRHFLEDEVLEGRDEFWGVIPEHLHAEIHDDLRRAIAAHGQDWAPRALKVLAGNRIYADEIARESTRLGWEIDPNTVESVAFGEGFEQCAIAWKAMVGDYLGWARPIENDFQLSVSGAPCLFDAQFRERLDLDHDIRLFLWEKPNNLWLGFYARCRSRLHEPHYFANFAPGDTVIEAVDIADKVLWPADDSVVTMTDDRLRVPVLSGLRMLPDEGPCYLIGCNHAYAQFRDLLAGALIEPANLAPSTS
jgi:hypothetical protein